MVTPRGNASNWGTVRGGDFRVCFRTCFPGDFPTSIGLIVEFKNGPPSACLFDLETGFHDGTFLLSLAIGFGGLDPFSDKVYGKSSWLLLTNKAKCSANDAGLVRTVEEYCGTPSKIMFGQKKRRNPEGSALIVNKQEVI